jgi:hypothetical protein
MPSRVRHDLEVADLEVAGKYASDFLARRGLNSTVLNHGQSSSDACRYQIGITF